MKHSSSQKTIANCIKFLCNLDYCPDESAIKRQMDSIYQKQLKLSRADKQKQVEYIKEMYVPLRRRERRVLMVMMVKIRNVINVGQKML